MSLILHARIQFIKTKQMATCRKMGNFSKRSVRRSKKFKGGQEVMPLQESFWSPSYGQVTDKFGVTWQISTEISEES